MIDPHGGKLINRIVDSPEAERELREEAKGLRASYADAVASSTISR